MEKTLVCIDFSNLHYYLIEKQWKINWGKFRDHISKLYPNTSFVFYDGIRCRDHFMSLYPEASKLDFFVSIKKKKGFFKYLRKIGYGVEWKFTVQVTDPETGEAHRKCNFDVEITMDAFIRMNDYDRFILCSGDRDFLKLMRYLKQQGKETVLVYPADRTSGEFKRVADSRMPLGPLKETIGERLDTTNNK